MSTDETAGPDTSAPTCDNCLRFVHATKRVAVLVAGELAFERDLCSACKVHALDCATQPAPWIQAVPVR